MLKWLQVLRLWIVAGAERGLIVGRGARMLVNAIQKSRLASRIISRSLRMTIVGIGAATGVGLLLLPLVKYPAHVALNRRIVAVTRFALLRRARLHGLGVLDYRIEAGIARRIVAAVSQLLFD